MFCNQKFQISVVVMVKRFLSFKSYQARSLRRRATPTEKALWLKLRDRTLFPVPFRRQHVIKPYIVDFICVKAWLIVETDGSVHTDLKQQDYDRKRTFELERKGYKVIRFWNYQVKNDIDWVVDQIAVHYQQRLSLPPLSGFSDMHRNKPDVPS